MDDDKDYPAGLTELLELIFDPRLDSGTELVKRLEPVFRDAERWRAMRKCLVAVDWTYGDPPMQAVVFELHAGIVSAGPEGADAIADAAVKAVGAA